MTTGLLLGKFAPLTTGHEYSVRQAASQVDALYVVLCYDQKFNDMQSERMSLVLSERNRYLWLRETFKDNKKVHVIVVDESKIDPYPEGGADFTKLVRAKLQDIQMEDAIDLVFSSEPTYDEYFAAYFPEARHVVIDADRENIPISATAARNDIYGKWEYLADAVKKDFTKSIVVIGCESTGKSTLVKNLAEYFDTVSVPEVGRTICEERFFSQEKYMSEQDYVMIAYEHKLAEKRAQRMGKKFVLSDTNNLITEFSALCMGLESDTLKMLSARESYDLVLYLDIDVPWVADGLRQNGSPDKRKMTNQMLLDLCKERCVKNIVCIDGSFEERFKKAVNAIEKIIE